MTIARKAALLAFLTLLLLALPAHAGTYTVHSCTTPSGRWVGADGWVADSPESTQGREVGSVLSCDDVRTPLGIYFGDHNMPVDPGVGRRWALNAPSGTAVTAIEFARRFELGWPVEAGLYGRPYLFEAWFGQDPATNPIEAHTSAWGGTLSSSGLELEVSDNSIGSSSVSFALRCWEMMGEDLCGPLNARVDVDRATVQLTDVEAPTGAIGEVPGEAVRGVVRLQFSATDVGGGVYRARLTVDGAEVSSGVVDGHGGRCADVEPGNGDAHEFASPQPCPLAADGEVAFDGRLLGDGAHAVALHVEDAAGNVAQIGSATISTHNAPISIVAPALGGAARVGGTLTASAGTWDGAVEELGYRWLRCDAGAAACIPIAGASGDRYTLAAGDAYHRVSAEVVAANGSGSAAARSAASGPVADVAGHTAPGGGDGQDGPGGDGSGGGGPGGGADGTQRGPAGAPGSGTTGGGGARSGTGTSGGGGVAGGGDRGGAGPASANGANASARARLTISLRRRGGRAARRVRGRHTRRWTVVGRLRDERGRGIADARVTPYVRVVGRRWARRRTLRTRAGGKLALRLGRGPSRDVRLAYAPFAGERTRRRSNMVRVRAYAPLTITARPRRVAAGGEVVLRGRVGGPGIPRRGLLVTLQGYQPGYGWRTFRTIRTARSGRWRTRYRFRSSAGRFGFRAVVPRQGRHPYLSTTSAPLTVSVG